jgi:hypothetical protein
MGIVFGAISLSATVGPAPAASASADSAVTITALDADPDPENAPLPDLQVTVSQTTDLVQQGLRISWTGGLKSVAPSAANGGENFLQIFQCWGDDPTDPTRPDRTTCQYGGANSPGATRDSFRPIPLEEIPAEDAAYSVQGGGFNPAYTAIPFKGYDGTFVSAIKEDPTTHVKSIDPNVNINVNSAFTSYTTNEVPWAGSGNDGTGSVSFEVQTASQSPALGCGTEEAVAGGVIGKSCWLVILPRGTSDNGSLQITQSGLLSDSWKHALAVKLDFAPIGSRCPEGTSERQLQGSELIALAVNSWQPVVCNQSGGGVYSLLTNAESDSLVAASSTAASPLALASYPLATSGTDPLRYAPIALTGITISLAIDRRPSALGAEVPEEVADAAHLPFTSVNLTPRLLAKLLTNTYKSSLPTGADVTYLGTNPWNVTVDPDFLAVNDPEWGYQALIGAGISDLIVPQGRSDAARAVWSYIVSDPEAVAFLSGQPDPYGTVVNPWYSTDPAINPSGTPFLAHATPGDASSPLVPKDNFPKADPLEYTPANQGPINVVTWRPYANDLGTVAYLTLRGDAQGPGAWDPDSTPPKYGKSTRMTPGFQSLLGLTDASASSRYQVVTANLRNPAGSFVGATTDAMLTAASAMSAIGGNGQVLSFVPTSSAAAGAPGAYPLTMPVYAAANPAMTDASLRANYADFIRYAATDGQVPGPELGDLPAGYAPIPQSWTDLAWAAADAIEAGPQKTTPPKTTGTTTAPIRTTTGGSSTPVPVPNPSATGEASGPIVGKATPDDPERPAVLQAALPISIASGAIAAIALPFLSRRRPL